MRLFLRFRRPSKPTLFALLMGASALTALCPPDSLRPVKSLTQFMAPLQLATLEATRRVAAPFSTPADHAGSTARRADLAREKQALENETVVLRQQMTQLQATIQALTGIRQSGFPDAGVLIPARVIAMDAAPGRDSLVVGKGRLQTVQENDWVVSQLEIDVGAQAGVRDACAVLARQCLIGWVEQTAPLTSRVVLLSDRLARRPMRAHIASKHEPDGKLHLLTVKEQPLAFALEGAGGGRMRIRDIRAGLVEAGHIRVGDLVTSDPNDPKLPLAMVVGEIETLKLNRASPVYYDALVRSLYDPRTLRQVFIANLSMPAAQTPG